MSVHITQCDRILRHLKDHGSIDPITAMQEYGIMRLAARIVDLRDQGHRIDSVIVSACNRYGEHVNHAVYSLDHRPAQQSFFDEPTNNNERKQEVYH